MQHLPIVPHGDRTELRLAQFIQTTGELEEALVEFAIQPIYDWAEYKRTLYVTAAPYEDIPLTIRNAMVEDILHRRWSGADMTAPLAWGRLNLPGISTKRHIPRIGMFTFYAGDRTYHQVRYCFNDDQAITLLPEDWPAWDELPTAVTKSPFKITRGPYTQRSKTHQPAITTLLDTHLWGFMSDLPLMELRKLLEPDPDQLMLNYLQLDGWAAGMRAEWERLAKIWLPRLGPRWEEAYANRYPPLSREALVDINTLIPLSLVFATRWMTVTALTRALNEEPHQTFLSVFIGVACLHTATGWSWLADMENPEERAWAIHALFSYLYDFYGGESGTHNDLGWCRLIEGQEEAFLTMLDLYHDNAQTWPRLWLVDMVEPFDWDTLASVVDLETPGFDEDEEDNERFPN